MLKMYLMRGLPGSGKSTLVKELLKKFNKDDNCVFSTDNFYIPVTKKIQNLLKTDNYSVEETIKLSQQVFNIWNSSNKHEEKNINLDLYLEFTKLFNNGKYEESLLFVKNNSFFEYLEYCNNFSVTKCGMFHKQNFNNFKKAIDDKQELVIVDNTNVSLKEGSKYIKYANENKYDIEIKEPESPHWKKHEHVLKHKDGSELKEFINILFEKNKHGVPKDVILNMANKWFYKPTIKDFLKHD